MLLQNTFSTRVLHHRSNLTWNYWQKLNVEKVRTECCIFDIMYKLQINKITLRPRKNIMFF